MKILGLVGSPRKDSNTDLLVSAILEGAAKNKHATEKVYLSTALILLPALIVGHAKKATSNLP